MPAKEKHRLLKREIPKTILIFFGSYLLFLVLWIQVKGYYGHAITFIASKAVMIIKDVEFEEMTNEDDVILAIFSPLKYKADMYIDIPVNTSFYTFNAPLTLAIMAGLYLFIGKRGKAYGEALLVLLAAHILYVFSLEANQLTEVLTDRGIEGSNMLRSFFYQFLWSFTDNMIIRFEPFLIGFYVFMRFKKEKVM